ncbi:hypothetical protein, partial [Actinoalloteichus spitiensis]|uniref:hypothetical protein n=1 Tax=Actinoalloteichus spitiensis TaxID=252394 RepID=UPI0004751000
LVRSATASTACAPPENAADVRHERSAVAASDVPPPSPVAELTPHVPQDRLDTDIDCDDPRSRTELSGFVPIPGLSSVPTEISVLLAENGGGVLLNETIELTPGSLAEDGQCPDSGARAVLRVDGGGRFFAE